MLAIEVTMKHLQAILIALLLFVTLTSSFSSTGFRPKEGFVPDKKTAIAVAEAVLIPIYGKKQIDAEKPLRADLKDGIWTVSGTLPDGWDGGVAVVKLSKLDARIIDVIHYK
jgi:hypothetical protein